VVKQLLMNPPAFLGIRLGVMGDTSLWRFASYYGLVLTDLALIGLIVEGSGLLGVVGALAN
jgi:hypothetical protein